MHLVAGGPDGLARWLAFSSTMAERVRLISIVLFLASVGSSAGVSGAPARGDAVETHSGTPSMRTAPATPAWAIPFGREFWRFPRNGSFSDLAPGSRNWPRLAENALGDAMDRINHAFAPQRETCAEVRNEQYAARLSAEGFTFVPAVRPASTADGSGALAGASAGNCEARLRTLCINRSGRQYFSATPHTPALVLGNTRQRLLDAESGLVEHVEARQSGIELSWILPRQLPGGSPLTIDVEVAGLQFSCQTPTGVHFSDAIGTPRLKISPVTAMDQAGHHWPVPLVMAGENLRIEVPSEVLAAASFPLAIDPIVSAEFGLDQPVPGPTPCTRAAPAVAVNYDGFLVVWSHGKGEATDPGVYAARVDPLGNLLDPFGILVSASAGEQTTCKVAALPDGFLVVWSAPHGASLTDWDILATRVQSDGTVLDAIPLPVCTVGGVQTSPAVAANGDNYLVVWADYRGTGIYGTIVTPDGRLSPTNGFPICTAIYEQYTPAVAALGTNYLVVWQDYRNSTTSVYASDIYGARVTGNGVLLDVSGIPICRRPNSQYQPAVAANTTNYLVLWEDYDLGGNDIMGARIGADGSVLDTNALVIAHGANAQCNPAAVGNFDDFLVVWQDYRGSPGTNFVAATFATRVRADGSVVYPDGVAVSNGTTEQWFPALAGFWDDFLVVWQDSRNNPDTTLADIYGASVDSGRGFAVYPDAEVSISANIQVAPKVAANGTNFLVVWADNRRAATNGWDILGLRLDEDGTLLDSSPIAICTATNHQTDPAVAAQGTNFLVVWSDQRNAGPNGSAADIFGAFVDPAGVVSPAGGFPICLATNDQVRPAVSPLGQGYFVAWQDGRTSTTYVVRWDIYGSRISPTGEVLDPEGIAICTNLLNQTTPVAAGNLSQALVAWTDFRAGSNNTDILAARVAADGSLLDTNPLAICTASGAQSTPAVATDGAGYLVAWADPRNTSSAADIYAAKVNLAGVVSPTNGFAIRIASGQQSAPAVAFDGWDYLVAWQEARSSASNSFDIFATGVTPDGTVFSGGPLMIDTNAFNQLVPAAAAGPDGRFLVVNQGFQYQARRAVANLVNVEAIPRFDAAALASDGQFQFRLRCAPGQSYVVEASENLQTWAPFADFSSTNYFLWLSDPGPTNLPHRFYRAFLLP